MQNTINVFNKYEVANLKAEAKKALAEVEAKFGVTFDLGAGRYNEQSLSFKVTATLNDEADKPISDRERQFKLYAPTAGLQESDLGKMFNSHNENFRITGWNNRNRKYKIIAENIRNHKSFKFGVQTVLRGLGE